ncbi:hypothetical protein JOB18_031651 [Solea senegalensis]|uniref:Uncharacterized protein n=1 Tax=Solea senegalensis TaxID=28829 RepID=A0AAV6T0D9_SOLSE|nr:hypothetical protein JOB18_031651 [Solea senegalensis]
MVRVLQRRSRKMKRRNIRKVMMTWTPRKNSRSLPNASSSNRGDQGRWRPAVCQLVGTEGHNKHYLDVAGHQKAHLKTFQILQLTSAQSSWV